MTRYSGIDNRDGLYRPSNRLENARLTDIKSYDPAAIHKLLGGALEGKEDLVIKFALKHNLNPAVFAAVIAHEASKGHSSAAWRKNNFTGICGNGPPVTFSSVEKGLDEGAKLLAQYIKGGRDTIAKIQEKYAPTEGATNDPTRLNKYWQKGVAGYLATLMNGNERFDTSSSMLAMAHVPLPIPRPTRDSFVQPAAYEAHAREVDGTGLRNPSPRSYEQRQAVTFYDHLPGRSFTPFG
jgi:hypothetical protein